MPNSFNLVGPVAVAAIVLLAAANPHAEQQAAGTTPPEAQIPPFARSIPWDIRFMHINKSPTGCPVGTIQHRGYAGHPETPNKHQ
jgi:hypothetical protein